ncbi:MAG: DUF420 domain-containing protein [Nitrospirae bacterium]|nr:DUF420 domain-containing protein [Nitrospirota bacterium]
MKWLRLFEQFAEWIKENAETLKQPGFFGTHATMGADLSQTMAALFTGLFVIGWVQARRGKAGAHHWLMFGGMIAMLAFFTSYYLFRQLGVLAVEGKEGFGGSQALYDHVFIPVLILHIILVIIGLVMAVYMIVLGFRAQIIEGGRSRKLMVCLGLLVLVATVFSVEFAIQRIWPDGARRHRALGRFTMVIYCILFLTGSFTYSMLYILYPGKIG